MDPQGSERYEHGPGSQGRARAVQLVADEYLLTVNPVDGSEIEPCPPGEQLDRPVKLPPDQRPAPAGAHALPVPPSPPPFLERDEERERLTRLLSRGRSVRLTGPAGSGRSTLLDAVAEDVAALAPDGVVRLSGYHRTPSDLLYELYSAVHRAPLYRPGKAELLQALSTVGAVVVVDDLEFGGAALDEVLRSTPECAFLLAATPDVAAPAADSRVEELFLAGLSRTACLELLEHAVHRPLTDQEADWAGDLWFGSEGLALRFVQAGALLRLQGSSGVIPALTDDTALAPLLAAALPESGLQTLRLALALGGELPHATHLPALTGDQQADDCLPELLAHGLISPAGDHFRIAPGVAEQLAEAGYAEGAEDYALAATQHYTWWAGHPSVTAGRVAIESAPVLAAIRGAQRGGNPNAAVLLSRTAAPVLAAGLRWSAWERALRCGQESARASGEIAEEAYFHHELGVLALTTGNPERARAELEAAIALRGTLAEQRGIVAGRRALALVTDRLAGGTAGARTGGPASSGASLPSSGYSSGAVTGSAADAPGGAGGTAPTPHDGVPVSATTGVTASVPSAAARHPESETLVAASGGTAGGMAAGGAGKRGGAHGGPSRWAAFTSSKRNVAAAGAGALLAAVLGTIVTLGAASEDGKPDTVRPDHSTSQEDDEDGVTADRPPKEDGSGSTSGQPAAGPGSRVPGAGRTSAGSSNPDTREPSSPRDSSSASEDPSNDPGKPPSSPHDPPSSPDDPPSSPDDPPSSPDPTPTPTDDPTTQKPPSGTSGGDAGGSGGGGGADGGTRRGDAPSGQGTPDEAA
ncbi:MULTISPECIES: ATP-binding protein [unclassified Streptomyces]|uniref:ATP-binding protein n=1 Tax=unclassified Streptomyces TaxID=2593676 RepID=UPI002DD8FEE8|nr:MULTISPECIES: ATP-binding protein [unclassified Streptomyces]WSA92311.1 ATP-binding protein [Streptomyces sp. NBC_01795]WSS15033.1 ATP-binding protein [Streptomyces sp. NBC_01186]WSS43876.1 ATP-binding protein [Streptomyces sp. NBC_01187]